MPNLLAQERGAYLRQHQSNPVDWLPWGEFGAGARTRVEKAEELAATSRRDGAQTNPVRTSCIVSMLEKKWGRILIIASSGIVAPIIL
jgi:Protein of unknown function, DUF255